ncbi:Hypothetical protein NTJ_14135 [Nesidiocoris tenuis]|uniref:THAP-type domain-containing protein n=1 Tax=Nesidiocoris tenuis TaxID=355587 RepID=A0ABN7BEP8_9HEMI|nr:Hypothetical protein NTJ_14135 [Nesidiocoris tenuis]
MGRKCEVDGCITNIGNPDISLFKFPTDPENEAKWLVAIGKPSLSTDTYSRICSRHFKLSDFEPEQAPGELALRLRPNAVPTLLLKNPNRPSGKQRRVCKAKGCGVNTVDYPDEKLFAFPIDPKRNKVWCRVAEFVADESMGGYFMLCKRHFKKSSFRDATRRNLRFRIDPCYKTGPLNPKTGDYCPIGQEEQFDFDVDEESAVMVVEDNFPNVTENVTNLLESEIIVGEPLISDTVLDSDSDSFSDNWIDPEEDNIDKDIASSEFVFDATPLASICFTRDDQSSECETSLDEKRQKIITRLTRLISDDLISGAPVIQDVEKSQNSISETGRSSQSANHVSQPLGRTARSPPNKKRKKINAENEKAHSLMMESSRHYRLLKSTLVQGPIGNLSTSTTGTTGEQFSPSLPSMRESTDVVTNDVFSAVAERMSYNEDDQYPCCALLWDKIPIYREACPDLLADTPELADYALVFMAVGLFHQWCQPLAYQFMSNDQGASAVADIVRRVLSRCYQSGLRVKATICNWTIQNRMAYARLGVSSRHQYLLVNGVRVSCLYDSQRLLLQTRNMFREFDIVTRTGLRDDDSGPKSTAKWSDIEQAVAEDKKNSIRLMRKLTPPHLEPFGRSADKIELAAQVFSDTVAASIETFARYGVLESRAKATAFVAMFFNRLYDSLTGSSPYPDGGGGLRCRLQTDREHFHLSFWKYASSTLAQMKLVSHDMKEFPQLKSWQASGWIATVDGMKSLWNDLRVELSYMKFLELTHLNLSPIEWLLDAVRIYWNPEEPSLPPTAQEFSLTMESCMRLGIVNSFSGTCEFPNTELELSPADLGDTESASYS